MIVVIMDGVVITDGVVKTDGVVIPGSMSSCWGGDGAKMDAWFGFDVYRFRGGES